MGHLHAAALAIHLGQRVRAIEAHLGVGSVNTALIVWSSSLSIRRICSKAPRLVAAVAGSLMYSQVKITSSAVKGVPSCQTTPCLRRQIVQVPSGARPPFSR